MTGNLPPAEVSVVIPCLNEAETIGLCVRKAAGALADHGITGEILVADNGSTDGSREIAAREGARVVQVGQKGYGNALMGGIEAARGRFIVMGDADDSYDFREVPRFIEPLRAGFDLVQGCRLPGGGGRVMTGAMPWLHRCIGNPFFSLLSRGWFNVRIHDVYCGMRAFTKTHYESLDQRCVGMEFATEMIIKSSLRGARITEVPITLHPDGRTRHPPHLRTWRDGWRTLRFFLMSCPRWLFLIPGMAAMAGGTLAGLLVLLHVTLGNIVFDAHTLLYGSVAILCGYETVLFAVFTKTFAVSEGLLPEDPRVARLLQTVTLERGILLGLGILLAGLVLLARVFVLWRDVDFGRLNYAETMRWAIPGATLTALGLQTIMAGFFISILGMRRKR